MKRPHPSIQATITLSLALAAATASAQSSVTVFGVVDAAARTANTDRAGSIASLASGSFSSSRFGFRGQEDLGDGQSVAFWLESFLSIDTGVVTPTGFQRRSTLSFIDRRWGELRLGRDYTPTHSNWARFDPFNYVGIGSVQLLILSATGTTPVTAAFKGNPNDIQRANNGVQYLLPQNPWGLEGGLVYTFGEGGAAANDQHKSVGGRLGINLGPVLLSAATLTTRDTAAVSAFKDTAFAASYATPVVRLSAGVRRLAYQDSAQNNYLLAAVVPVGLQEFKVAWNRAQMQGTVGTTNIANNRADQYALGYVYSFSKRTRLFATAATIRNRGNSRFVIPGAPSATAGGLASRGFEVGLNQEF